MIPAKELTRGMVVEIDGAPCLVERISVQTPSARGGNTLYKVRARNLETKGKVDKTFKGTDALGEVEYQKRPVQFLYRDGKGFCFMDLTDYDQFTLQEEDLEEESPYLIEEKDDLFAMMVNGRVIGIQVPDTVDLEIADTGPAVRGDSATGRTKPATLSTGLTVQVPEYLKSGDVIRVDTRTGKFLQRVSN